MSNTLSIFIDESGDCGDYEPHSPYYIVTMLFHNQKDDISDAVRQLDGKMKYLGYESHVLHTGPMIRREKDYIDLTIDERKSLFMALIHFYRHVKIRYASFHVEKKECSDIIDLTTRISKHIRSLIDKELEYFQSFDEIIVYYDNGQIELTRTLTSTLSVLLSNVVFRKVKQSEYRLIQLADMICSLELTAIKFETKQMTQSDLEFFHSYKNFKKDYLAKIRKSKFV